MSRGHRAEYGSDLIVDLMKAVGIEFVAFNPGATFRGIHDSIVNYGGNRSPEIIECCHEEIAVAIAHGYAKAKGKPMATIVHNIVGLQHAAMAIFNAWCDRVPVLIFGGTGPMDATRRRPWIDWIHTALVQGNVVRDYVKWDDQPYSIAAIPESFLRGYRIALTEPCGPVYICFDVDLQEARLDGQITVPQPERCAPPSPLPPNLDALRRAALFLANAKSPVILAGTLGRNPRAVPGLIELAELLAAPVVDRGQRFNFPNTHPLDLTGAGREALQEADVVLALDVADLFGALGRVDKATREFVYHIKPDTRIIDISLNDLAIHSWAADYQRLQQADVRIMADTALAVPQLINMLRDLNVDSFKRAQRWAAVEAKHNAFNRQWKSRAEAEVSDIPISAAGLAALLWEAVKGEDWVLVNGTLNGWARRLWEWSTPGQFLGTSGGAGLGYGIGAALGAALAYRDTGKLCIDLQNDGDFLYCTSALWTAAHHRIPLLIVMNNNRTYYNSEEHQIEVARMRERDVANAAIGTRIDDPPISYAQLAHAFGIHAEGPVERPEDVVPAVRRAIAVVKEQGAPALVDIVTKPTRRIWGE